MNTRHCLEIAERMGALLKRELGEGVEPLRLMHDARYARDVLLVCTAHRNAELQTLARAWREALAERETVPPGGTQLARRVFGESGYGASRFGPEQPGFFHSRPATAADTTGFGTDSAMTPMPVPASSRKRAWYSPARWFGSR